ncbi:three-Cys-motif partner protein TcmP [Achromobacter ruhlandii]|uniref:three-Cys-motif partner protein TcmP n=1 Tax=Achromobacter ruhlandii TaxID=72557 RepID=UPI003BA012B3
MSKKKDKWAWAIGEAPPPIQAHSQIKHLVIKDYLSRYIRVLMANPLVPRLPLTLVDGFAGGGLYQGADHQLVPGSPLLLLDTVRAAEAELNVDRHTTRRCIDARYHFVEVIPSTYAHLNHVLCEYGHGNAIGERIHLHQASFSDVAQEIINAAATHAGERALFLLDQYNYSDVDLRLVNRILTTLRGSEVLLTFNVDSLISFLSDTPQSKQSAASIGLDQYIDWVGIRIMKSAGRYREAIQRQLAAGIFAASGAKFMTLFFVTPEGASPWSYWLVHLSNAYKANDVMKEVHWTHGNAFGHSLEPGLFQLGYQASRDYLVTGQGALEFDTPKAFDQALHLQSVDNLREHVCSTLFERQTGVRFGDMVVGLANKTNATADMIREALHLPIDTGEIVAVNKDGGFRRKGMAIAPDDRLIFKQNGFHFV